MVWPWLTLSAQKFRAHLLESEKLPDIVAYLLLFCLEHKDKPRESIQHSSDATSDLVYRAPWSCKGSFLYHSNHIRGDRVWIQVDPSDPLKSHDTRPLVYSGYTRGLLRYSESFHSELTSPAF